MTVAFQRVVKIGGSALAPEAIGGCIPLLKDLCQPPTIVVHGHGRDAARLGASCGLERRLMMSPGGDRVKLTTSADAVVGELAAILAGERLHLFASANALHFSSPVPATRFLVAERRPRFRYVEDNQLLSRSDDYGGRIVRLRPDAFAEILAGASPPILVSCVARTTEGDAVAVDADSVAAAIASHVGATELLFLTDVPGVLGAGDRAVVPSISREDLPACVASIARGGMRKKLKAAGSALRHGVAVVVIGSARKRTYEELVADGTTCR